jgi:hypothetical protein
VATLTGAIADTRTALLIKLIAQPDRCKSHAVVFGTRSVAS